MHLYLPRRYRRPLLFPPGLLALAGLLWLGCVALGPWQERLKPISVLQLTMPPLESTIPTVLPSNSIPLPPPPPYLTRVEFNKILCWQDAHFGYNEQINKHVKRWIASSVRAMMNNTKTGSGVRIKFMSNSHYKDLVFVLNLMNEENVRRWFLDVRQEPAIVYAYKKSSESGRLSEFEERCLPSYNESESISKIILPNYKSHSYLLRFDNWITTIWNPKLIIKSNYSYLHGTGYDNLIFGPERIYLSYLNHCIVKALIPFKKWEWSVPLYLISVVVISNILRLRRRF